MKKLIAGNWKMNGSRDDARALIADIVNKVAIDDDVLTRADILVCPPAIHINDVRHALYGFPSIAFGAQDVAETEEGAFTGDLSAKMLKDSGCSYVIIGHSERRQYHGETSAQIAQKAQRALENDIIPIICVGESEAERDAGQEQTIVAQQLIQSIPTALKPFHQIVIAYEPVWAIGTGKTASAEDVATMHAFIRSHIKDKVPNASKTRILYGGSMKPENAATLLTTPNVDGGLIGGASLNPDSFLAIAKAS